MGHPSRRIALTLLATSALITPSLAAAVTPAPKFASPDDHGVDLTSGLPFLTIKEGAIGSGPGRIELQRIWAEGAGFVDNWSGGFFKVSGKGYVQIAGYSSTFTWTGSAWTNDKADGATLTQDISGTVTYTSRDGTVITFVNTPVDTLVYACPGADATTCQTPLSVVRPDGTKFKYTWTNKNICEDLPGEPCAILHRYKRLASVSSSAGYSVTFGYGASADPPDPAWFRRVSATFDNSASHPSPLPAVSYAFPNSTTTTVTDPGGRVWTFTVNGSGQLTGVRRPGSGSDNITYSYTSGLVTSSTMDGVTNSYSRSVVGTTGTMTVTNPLSQTNVIVSDLNIGRPTSFKDGLNRTTSYQYDTNGRLTRTTAPEGNYVEVTYDSRANVTQTKAVAKSGSGLSDIIATASFDTTCTNAVKCNKPNSTTDAKGNVTDYTYDATHGGLLTVTRPAPTGGGVRPQTRYTYTQVQGAGDTLNFPAVYMLTGLSACQTTSSCTAGADETKLTIAYNSNLLATTVTRANGTGTLSATATNTYDPRGNVSTVDGPLSGTSDTTKYRYDSVDQLVGVISPDPDGAGSLKNRAIRLTYRSDAQVSKKEIGTVNSQSDADWALFSALQTADIGFDSNARAVTSKLSAGGTDYALIQISYDALGRQDCRAVRMNTAIYGSLPASACTLGTAGSFGPDRISQNIYDAAGQVTQLKEGVGTSDAATERTLTFSNNGKLATLKDAEANLTTYEYDGFDRLSKTRYPDTTKGAGTSSATDYEQLTYDANSNVTSRRLRDGNSIGYTLDNLNRTTLKDLPGSEPDVAYAYDNLNRITSATQTGNSLTFTWDALGHRLTETGAQGTATSEYDLAGRRTKLTYPGSGLYVNFDRLVTGEISAIRENGATSGVGVLATYVYDNLGNITSHTFGNGASQALSYDAVGRLSALTSDLTGTSNDLSVTFGYTPAPELASTVRTGDTYAWTGHVNENRNYTSNGLNQYTASGTITPTYDTKGNLTSAGSTLYCYSSENLLSAAGSSCASPTVTLGYDPALRLYQIAGASTTRFAYDGVNMIAEYDGSNALQRRFVFGPGMDEPIVQYEGSGTTDRRFMSADERGSIISTTDSSGALLNINRYDEYGIPQSTNSGRFQYTGQAWLSELGMQYSKARIYSPTLGRFLQTDPIGYGDGPNWYAYVHNDPINSTDPLGLGSDGNSPGDIIITACQNGGSLPYCTGGNDPPAFGGGAWGGGSGTTDGGSGDPGGGCVGDCSEIVVTAPPPPPKAPPTPIQMADAATSQQQLCNALDKEVADATADWAAQDSMYGFTRNFQWDDLNKLNAELQWALGDLSSLESMAGVADPVLFALGLGGAATGLPKGKGANSAWTLVAGVVGWNLHARIDMQRAKVRAIKARINQINAQNAGTCTANV
jgi:RHS repeat-associated protein